MNGFKAKFAENFCVICDEIPTAPILTKGDLVSLQTQTKELVEIVVAWKVPAEIKLS